jgi:hypothetical protein
MSARTTSLMGVSLCADTTLSFTSVPTDALWTYTAKAGLDEAYTLGSCVHILGLVNSVGAQEDSTTALESPLVLMALKCMFLVILTGRMTPSISIL